MPSAIERRDGVIFQGFNRTEWNLWAAEGLLLPVKESRNAKWVSSEGVIVDVNCDGSSSEASTSKAGVGGTARNAQGGRFIGVFGKAVNASSTKVVDVNDYRRNLLIEKKLTEFYE